MATRQRKNPKEGTITKTGQIVGRGENKTVIPPDEVAKLAQLHATTEEIAAFFGVPVQTITYNFGDIITKAKAETKIALRRSQIKLALDGNCTMLIWLGKQYLNQSDKVIEEKPESLPADELDKRIAALLQQNNSNAA